MSTVQITPFDPDPAAIPMAMSEPGLLRRVAGLAERGDVTAFLLVAPAVLFFLALFVVPVGNMIGFSFFRQSPTGDLLPGLTLANYERLANVDLYRKVLMTTLRVSLFTTIGAMILAYPVALVMVRGHPLVSRVLAVIVIAPLLVNVVIRTYGWRVILANSDQGVLNWALAGLGLPPVRWLYTEWAIVIGSIHVFMPLMALPLAAALGRISPSVEEAGRTLGASAWQAFRRVTLPLSVPGLAVGSTLVFSLTASSFVAPALLGGNFAKMLGTLVEEQIMSVFDWPFGAAIATVLIVIVLVINLAYVFLVERRFPAPDRPGEGTALGPAAVPLYAAAGLVALFLLAPLVVPVIISFSDTDFVTWPPRGFTLRWYVKILNEQEFTSSFRFSLMLGVLATLGALALGTPAAIGLVRYRFPGRGLVQGLLLSPLIFPMLVTGIALLRLSTSTGMQDSLVNLTLGHVLVTVPYVVRTVSASLLLVDPSIEEAARTLGANRLRGFWLVTRPQIMPGLVAGAIFAFVTSFDNYPVSMWLADAVNIPLPLMIFTLTSRFFDPGIAAIASLMILLSVALILVMEKVTGLKRAMSM